MADGILGIWCAAWSQTTSSIEERERERKREGGEKGVREKEGERDRQTE